MPAEGYMSEIVDKNPLASTVFKIRIFFTGWKICSWQVDAGENLPIKRNTVIPEAYHPAR
jgi:hypothetical protein